VRILFCREARGPSGPPDGSLAPAIALAARGHRIGFALPDLQHAATRLAPHGFAFFQAPMAPPSVAPASTALGHVDLLRGAAFASREVLGALAAAWTGLVDLWRPELLVVDRAPAALVAARREGIPCALVGDGLAVPPRHGPLPPFTPSKAAAAACERRELECVDAVNALLPSQRRIEWLSELHRDVPRSLCTWRELDHFGEREDETYLGPLLREAANAPGEAGASRGSLVAHLRWSAPAVAELVAALESLALDTVASVAELPERAGTGLRHVRLSDAPQTLAATLEHAAGVVCHTEHDLVAASLRHGVPLLLLPSTPQEFLLTKRVLALGVAKAIHPAAGRPAIESALRAFRASEPLRARAGAFAARYAGFDPARHAVDIAERIEAAAPQRPDPGRAGESR